MKRLSRVIIPSILVLMTICCFASCGKKADETAYDTKYLGLNTQYRALGAVAAKNDSVYLLAYEATSSGDDKIVIAAMNGSGSAVGSFSYAGEQFAPVEQGWAGQNNVTEIAPDSAGDLWLLEEHYSFLVTSDAAEADSNYRREYALTKVDAEGNVLLSIDINGLLEGKDGRTIQKQLLCDNEDNVYLLLRDDRFGSLLVYDSEGQPIYAPDEKIAAVAMTQSGTVMAVVQNGLNDALSTLCAVDAAAHSLGEKTELDVSCGYIYGGLGNAILINDSQKVYSYDTETGELTALFDWFDIDVVSSAVKYFAALPDGGYVLLGSGIYSDAPDVIMLRQVSADSLEQKTVLTLATGFASSEQKAAAVQFNRENPDYKIKIVEYGDINSSDASSLDRFNVDVNAGRVPDMIDMDYFSAAQLISAGVMEDLYPYLDSDGELSRSAFLPNLIGAIESDGCLYYLPRSFYLRIVAGNADVVGDAADWNMQKLYEAAETHKEYEYIMGSLCGQSQFLKLAMEFNMDDFVDFDDLSCDFEKPEFYELLNFAKANFPIDGDDLVFKLTAKQFAPVMEGEQMLYCGTVSMASDLMLINELLGGSASFVGFPSGDGNGNVFLPDSSMGITKASQHKDIAWDFLRGFYTEDSYTVSVDTLFPSNMNALEAVLNESTVKVFSANADGEQTEGAKFSYSFADEQGQPVRIELKALTEDDLDYVWSVINGVNKAVSDEDTIETIVAEEAGAFSHGDSTAEETAALINSRVKLFLGERGKKSKRVDRKGVI